MKIISMVTDYLKASLLTTKGDIIKHDGVSAKKFPIGPSEQILRANEAGDDLEYILSQYIHAYLTEKGDLIKYNGFYTTNFHIGTARQIMVVNHAGDDIEYQAAGGIAGQILRVNPAGEVLEYQGPGCYMFETVYKGKNIPDIDLAAGGVTVLDIDMGDVHDGEFFMIWGKVHCTNSGTATGVRFELLKGAGTATHIFNYDAAILDFPGYCENANSFHANLATIIEIITDGTFTLRVKGIGSTDCQVASGNCQLYIHQVRQEILGG